MKRRSPEPDKDSPAYIKRKIDQSFAIAAANLKDKSRVKHPSKRNVKVVDAFPMIPDLDTFPDSGTYVTVKFTNNPVPPSKTYDERLLRGPFRPIEKTEAETEAYDAALQAHERDPQSVPKPTNSMNYEYYLADSTSVADKFDQRFDVSNPDRDDDNLYTHKNAKGPMFQFNRIRAYETAQETELDKDTKYDEEVVIRFSYGSDAATGGDQKAAFYYPVMQRTTLRPQRTKNIARTIGAAVDEETGVAQLDVTVNEPPEHLKQIMERYKENPYESPYDVDEEEEGPAAAATAAVGGSSPRQQNGDDDADVDADVDADADAEVDAATNGRHQSVDEEEEDQDAEGDEED